jgi:hypothetical protein
VTGWHDTFIRCHDASTMQCLWHIPNAHRGAVMSVAAHSDASLSYLLSGGKDGSVRVWALRSREMMLQFVEHQKAVTQVLVDVKSPNLVHSAGADCQVLTYDLRRERRIIAHLVSYSRQFVSKSRAYDFNVYIPSLRMIATIYRLARALSQV